MKNWFKKYIPTVNKNSTTLKGLKSFLKNPHLWSYEHQCIARGVGAGLAGSVIPGFQIFYAAVLAILLRGNLPIALVCTLITNPITVVPMTYFVYFIGTLIIKNGNAKFVLQDFKWDFSSFDAFWSNLTVWILQFGKGFLIGLPIVSLSLGIIGYVGTLIVWKVYSKFFKKVKKH